MTMVGKIRGTLADLIVGQPRSQGWCGISCLVCHTSSLSKTLHLTIARLLEYHNPLSLSLSLACRSRPILRPGNPIGKVIAIGQRGWTQSQVKYQISCLDFGSISWICTLLSRVWTRLWLSIAINASKVLDQRYWETCCDCIFNALTIVFFHYCCSLETCS
jgi:hypothetical protein